MESDFHQRVINSIDTPMYVTDTNGTIIFINPAFEGLTGYANDNVVGRKTSLLKSGEMPDNYYVRLWDSILKGESWKEEIVNRRKDGNLYTALQSISPIKNENGQVEYFTAVQYDITREKELQDERTIFFNVSVDLFCIVDKMGVFKQLNDAWGQLLGVGSSDLAGRKMLDIVHSTDKEEFSQTLERSAQSEEVMSLDTRILTAGGTTRWVSWRLYYYSAKELFYISGRDIQKRVEMEQEIRRISVTDKLTGIYNRLHCDERLKDEMARAERNGKALSLIIFDIDHFKHVNDTYGHQRGDYVLVNLVKIVKEQIREYDFFARWGGEEFLILSPETGIKEVLALSERIRRGVESFEFEEVGRVTISLGISLLRVSEDTEESLLRRADEALYEAKDQGRNRAVISE